MPNVVDLNIDSLTLRLFVAVPAGFFWYFVQISTRTKQRNDCCSGLVQKSLNQEGQGDSERERDSDRERERDRES